MMLRRQGDRRQHHHGGYDETCKLAHASTLLHARIRSVKQVSDQSLIA
jgi:hypothetical protein